MAVDCRELAVVDVRAVLRDGGDGGLGGMPRSRRSSSIGPRFGSVTFCVATAPTPALAWGQRAPTAIEEVVMATPKAPDLAQRPAMEKVMSSSLLQVQSRAAR